MQGVVAVDFFIGHKYRMFAAEGCLYPARLERTAPMPELSAKFVTVLMFG